MRSSKPAGTSKSCLGGGKVNTIAVVFETWREVENIGERMEVCKNQQSRDLK